MIAVCGEALMDMVATGGGQPVPMPGGGPFNTARALARLGVKTAFIGRLSTDAHGRELAALLAGDGVNLSLATFGPEPSTLAIASLDSEGRATYEFVVDGTAAPNLTPEMLPAEMSPAINALHVGSLALVMEPIGTSLTQLVLRESGRRLIMLDPNVRPALIGAGGRYRERLDSLIAASTIVKASDSDLDWLFPGVSPESAARRIVQRGARLAVVTLGGAGALGVSAGAVAQVTAPQVAVVDTIGAGDVFGAALLAWLGGHDLLSAGLSLHERQLTSALEFACALASLACTRAGAEPPARGDLRDAGLFDL